VFAWDRPPRPGSWLGKGGGAGLAFPATVIFLTQKAAQGTGAWFPFLPQGEGGGAGWARGGWRGPVRGIVLRRPIAMMVAIQWHKQPRVLLKPSGQRALHWDVDGVRPSGILIEMLARLSGNGLKSSTPRRRYRTEGRCAGLAGVSPVRCYVT